MASVAQFTHLALIVIQVRQETGEAYAALPPTLWTHRPTLRNAPLHRAPSPRGGAARDSRLSRGLRGLRKVTTSLLTSANRSIKTRCPALSRMRSLASGMASARATALATGT